ncbi:MAG: hypothetical protein ACRDD1_03145, partial [Planctomycetia bacterium]
VGAAGAWVGWSLESNKAAEFAATADRLQSELNEARVLAAHSDAAAKTAVADARSMETAVDGVRARLAELVDARTANANRPPPADELRRRLQVVRVLLRPGAPLGEQVRKGLEGWTAAERLPPSRFDVPPVTAAERPPLDEETTRLRLELERLKEQLEQTIERLTPPGAP